MELDKAKREMEEAREEAKKGFFKALDFESDLAVRAMMVELGIKRNLKANFNLMDYIFRVKNKSAKTPYKTNRGFKIWAKKRIQELEKLLSHEIEKIELSQRRRANIKEAREEIAKLKAS